MKFLSISLLAAVLAAPFASPALAAQPVKPLVDSAWLKANLKKTDLVVLSTRLRTSRAVYERGHIPGAIFTHYGKDGWRARTKEGVVGMLPPVPVLEKLIGSLGIGNNSHVVLVPAGASSLDMGTATRIYWALKVLAHDKVSILDGGWKA